MQGRAVIALIAGLFFVDPMPAQAAGAWQVVNSPNPSPGGQDYLTAVTVAGLHDVWAVGFYENTNVSGLITEHWNGTAWSIVPNPPVPAALNLVAAYAVSPSDVWAIGTVRTTFDGTLVEHWNGKKWSVVPSPNLFNTGFNNIVSISGSATNDVWAVGFASPDIYSHIRAFAIHWNGSVWSIAPAPIVPVLNAVVDPQGSVWAFGEDAKLQVVAFHIVGKSWHRFALPNPNSDQQLVRGASATSPTNIWMVGQDNASNQFPYTEHFDGTKWDLIINPIPKQYDLLYGISAVGPIVWTVGDNIECPGGACKGSHALTEFWDGASWNPEPAQSLPHWSEQLDGVATVPGATYTWAVGHKVQQTGETVTLIEFHP